MDNSTAILTIKALDCLAAREVATAENIANAGTPNYRPLRVTFEDALKAAAMQGDDAVKRVMPEIEQAPANTELRTDLEMATATGTAGRYEALLETLSRQIQLQELAITGTS
jgi:flagellar basal-body rod protein FlgB